MPLLDIPAAVTPLAAVALLAAVMPLIARSLIPIMETLIYAVYIYINIYILCSICSQNIGQQAEGRICYKWRIQHINQYYRDCTNV